MAAARRMDAARGAHKTKQPRMNVCGAKTTRKLESTEESAAVRQSVTDAIDNTRCATCSQPGHGAGRRVETSSAHAANARSANGAGEANGCAAGRMRNSTAPRVKPCTLANSAYSSV